MWKAALIADSIEIVALDRPDEMLAQMIDPLLYDDESASS